MYPFFSSVLLGIFHQFVPGNFSITWPHVRKVDFSVLFVELCDLLQDECRVDVYWLRENDG